MNGMDWLAWTDSVGAWLSTYLLHSTVLLLPALALGRWLGARRLALQESLLRVALVGGLLTATAQGALGWQAATGSIAYSGLTTRAAVEAAPAVDTPRVAPPMEKAVGAVTALEAPRVAVATSRSGLELRTVPWLALAVAVWLSGALLLTLRLGTMAVALKRRLRGRHEVTRGGLFRLFWRLLAAADIDRPTRLTWTDRLRAPIALGLARREICLPRRVATGLSREQQETVLAHELAHLERRDPFWLLTGRLLESLLFLQPLNRWARIRLQEIAEYRCDDWAAERTGRPLTLARCLTEVATWRSHPGVGALAPTMAVRGSALGRRVRRLLDPGYSSLEVGLPAWSRPLAAAALLLVLIVVPGVSVGGGQEAPEASGESSRAAEPAPEAPEAEPADPVTGDGETPEAAPAADPVVPARPTAPAPAPSPEVAAADPSPGVTPVVGPEGIVGPLPAPAVPVSLTGEIARVEIATAFEVAPKVEIEGRVVDRREIVAVLAPRVRVVRSVTATPQEESAERVDAEGWRSEEEEALEEELDVLEVEVDRIADEIEQTFESEIETAMEELEEELESLEEEIESSLELELEIFEEEFDAELEAFEEEMERLEERVEGRLEAVDWESREELFEADLERIEDQVDLLCDRIDAQVDRLEHQLERRLERRLEHRVEHELEREIDALEHRLEREVERLERRAQQMVERSHASGGRLTAADREELLAEARRAAASARPTAEEIDAIRAAIDRMRAESTLSDGELDEMRMELGRSLQELRAMAQEGLDRQRRELEELRRKHAIL